MRSAIRTLAVPVRGRDGVCLLGEQDGELVAVALWCRMDVDYPLFKIRLLAVSTSVRGQGGEVARECLDHVLLRIVGDLAPGEVATVYGLVDRENAPSQRMLTDRDFEPQEDAPVDDPDLTMWALDVQADEDADDGRSRL